MSDWDARFMDVAKLVASWSKDPSTQCGACVVRPNRTIASVGYNGFPRGVADWHDRYADREIKYGMVVHAEVNAILVSQEPLLGYTLYSTLMPCSACAGVIIQSGITRVVAPEGTPEQKERWGDSFQRTLTMFGESGVVLETVL